MLFIFYLLEERFWSKRINSFGSKNSGVESLFILLTNKKRKCVNVSHFWLIPPSVWSSCCYLECRWKEHWSHRDNCHFLHMKGVFIIMENLRGCHWNLPITKQTMILNGKLYCRFIHGTKLMRVCQSTIPEIKQRKQSNKPHKKLYGSA